MMIYSNRRAVSPLIGNVLLVAIVVILFSITSVVVLGFTEEMSETTPLASFGTEIDDQNHVVTHTTGDSIDADKLYIVLNGDSKRWSSYPGGDGTVSAGDRVELTHDIPGDSTDMRIVYIEEGQSSILFESTLHSLGNSNTGNSGSGQPTVSSFSVSNPNNQVVKIDFQSDESLSSITADVTGAESATLSESDFNRNGRTYTATYDGGSDGQYTVTLKEAKSSAGDGASGQSGSVTISTSPLNSQRTVLYSGVNAISEDGSQTTSIGISGVDALGNSATDIDGDGLTEIPYIENGNLRVIDSDDNVQNLVADTHSSNPDTDKTLIHIGSWLGTETSIFYVNENHDTIYRVNTDGDVSSVASPNNGANAVVGIDDINGDNQDELIFADASQQIRYVESGGGTSKVQGGGVGSNNGIGVGETSDFDGDGIARVATVDGSNNIRLVGVSEPDITISSTSATKSPVTVSDIDSDSESEIVYVSTSGDIRYVDNPLGSQQVRDLTDEDGNQITGGDQIGVVSG